MGLGVVVVGLLTAAPASARLHLVASFQVKGTHGYLVHVVAHRAPTLGLLAKSGPRVGKVTVKVKKATESSSSFVGETASYSVPARFNKHRIRADLGQFGKVRLRFHKHPRYALPPVRRPTEKRIGVCGGGGAYVPGMFRGVFRFRGESGYTGARTHRVHGRLRRDFPPRCHGHDHGVALEARSGSTRFLALQDGDLGATALVASRRERAGRVKIIRGADRLTAADAGEFTFDQALTSAQVLPGGAPFTGTADYASPSNWAGSLAVSFPGEANVPLTGSGFTATLRNGQIPARALSTR